MFHLP